MRFLIAIPRFAPMGFAYDFPLGLGYVSAALKRAGHEVHCLNLNHEPGEFDEVLERKVREIDPDVFATGGLSPHFPIIAPLFSAARRAKPGIVNLVGGGIFSSDPDAVAPLLDIDIGAVGEADETVVDLASALEAGQGLDKVAGLALRQSDGGLRRTPERKALHDIDALPWPDYEGFGVDRLLSMQTAADNSLFHFVDEPRALPMVASRSCPYACTFCFHPIGRIYRERSLDSFFAELKDAVDRFGVNLLLVNDELFAVKKRRLMEFCERIGEFGIRWTAQMHVSILDAEAIAALKKAGCVHASYGLESMSDTVLASMKKKIDRTRLETALRLTHEAEIGIQGNFIFGDSAETLATADETMAWWARHREYHISLSLLQVYPGSPVYHRALAEGRGPAREDLIKETPAVNLTSMTDEEYRRFRFRTAIFRMTLTEPHPPLAFDIDDRPLPHRAETYHLAWECPRCGRRNDLRRVPLDSPLHIQYFRVTCRHCCRRVHLPNLTHRPWHEPTLEARYAEAQGLRAAGKMGEALAILAEIAVATFPSHLPDRPVAFIQANRDLGTHILESGGSPHMAQHYLGIALLHRCLDSRLHALHALALVAGGSTGAARLHAEQARRLMAPGDTALAAQLAGLGKSLREAEAKYGRDRYFS